MSARLRKAAIEVTSSAEKRLRHLISLKPESKGIKLGVRNRGCNGLSYTMDYSDGKGIGRFDESIQADGKSCCISSFFYNFYSSLYRYL